MSDEQQAVRASGCACRDDQPVFLRPQVKLEPLVCGWYVWTHLLCPLQHALNLVYRQLPLLRSFVENSALHLSAAADPSLFGGPFVDLPGERLPEVRQLLEDTTARYARLLRFAQDVKELDLRLQAGATGFSLGEFYGRVPQSLRGLVECLYDLNNHPRLRFFEELVYDENLAAGAFEVLLSSLPERRRRFFMSTPRLTEPGDMRFPMDIADRRIDLLAAMRTAAQPFGQVALDFGIDDRLRAEFSRYFTPAAPARREPEYRGEGVRVRYFGHACVLIQTAEESILLDPMLAFDDGEDGRLTFTDLPDRLDYVVLSHNHQDHCCPEMLMQLRHRVGRWVVPRNHSGSLADPSMKLALQRLGARNVLALEAFEEIGLAAGRIVSLPFPGEHVDLDVYARQGICIEIKGRRLAFLVDSDGCEPELFRRICARIGGSIDALFLGMECHGAPLSWLYGPLLTKQLSRRNDESRRLSGLDAARAWKVLEQLPAGRVFVYAMGQEPWLRYIMGLEYSADSVQLREVRAFLDRCGQGGIAAQSLFISHELLL